MEKSILYYGDNLNVLRGNIKDESVDLIYLDPPFNSQANYNVLFRAPTGEQSHAQIEAFEDTWHWGDSAEHAFDEVMKSGNTDAAELLRAMRSFLKENDMMAYLTMLAVRLLELHRVLTETGSLYPHCDPTASHYLKLLLDAVFGIANFRTEIIWKRSSAHSDTKQGRRQHGRLHDVIFFYTKSEEWIWNPVYTPYDREYVEDFYKYVEPETNRRYRLGDLTGPGGANVGVAMVRDLAHVVERENAKMGLFITPAPSTDPMNKEAVTAGFYEAPNRKDQYRKIQIATIGDLLEGKKPDLPPQDPSAFMQAPREDDAEQLGLLGVAAAVKPSRRKRS